MKAGIENRSLSAKMLAQLYEPQEGVHVQVGGLSAPRTASGHFFTSSSLAQRPRGASTPTALAACNAARVDLSASGTHRFVSACPCDDETAILHPHCTWQCIWPPQCKTESCEWRLPARNVGSLWTASFPCVQSTSLLNTPLLTQSLKSSVVSRNAQLASIHNQRMRRKREAAAAAAAAVAAAAGPAAEVLGTSRWPCCSALQVHKAAGVQQVASTLLKAAQQAKAGRGCQQHSSQQQQVSQEHTCAALAARASHPLQGLP